MSSVAPFAWHTDSDHSVSEVVCVVDMEYGTPEKIYPWRAAKRSRSQRRRTKKTVVRNSYEAALTDTDSKSSMTSLRETFHDRPLVGA